MSLREADGTFKNPPKLVLLQKLQEDVELVKQYLKGSFHGLIEW